MSSLGFLIGAFVIIYSIRLAIYFVWLYLATEKTIKKAKSFEHRTVNKSCNVLFIGDSLTFGAGASNPEKSIAGLFYRDNTSCDIHNPSVNKITTYELIDQLSKLKNSNFIYLNTILSIGGNDIIQFRSMRGIENRIKYIAAKLESTSKSVYILTPTKPGKSPLLIKLIVYRRIKKLRNIVRSLESKGVHQVDMWEAGDKLLANPNKYFVKDTVHLSDAGQLEWYNQLKIAMSKEKKVNTA